MPRNQANKLVFSSALLALALQAQIVVAQDANQAPTYPTWVTNDYPCVIKCIEDQLKDQTPPATDDQVNAALGCVRDTCNKATAEGNVYQAHYIINMYNKIKSIYEPESWQAGNAPNASELTAPQDWVQIATTATWTESDQPTTITTSVWAPPSTTGSASSSAATTDAAAAGAAGAADADNTVSAASGPANASSSAALPSASSNVTGGGNATANGTDAGVIEGAAGRLVVDLGVGILAVLGTGLVGGAMGGIGLLGW